MVASCACRIWSSSLTRLARSSDLAFGSTQIFASACQRLYCFTALRELRIVAITWMGSAMQPAMPPSRLLAPAKALVDPALLRICETPELADIPELTTLPADCTALVPEVLWVRLASR